MRSLVTGATGFIGRALSSQLVRDGHDVRLLVRSASRESALNGVGGIVVGDITDPEVVDRATRGPEMICGVAGAIREPHLSDERHREVNVEAVTHVMEAARRHGIRGVIHCSTVGIHRPFVMPARPAGDPAHRSGSSLLLQNLSSAEMRAPCAGPRPAHNSW